MHSPSEGPRKKTVVIVGTGWAGARVARDLDPQLFNIKVVSLRNHMIFTPLLPQTCTGTLEFRFVFAHMYLVSSTQYILLLSDVICMIDSL